MLKTVTRKYNRCLELTLSTGEVVVVKVLGDKTEAAAAAKRVLAELSAR